MDPGSNYFPTLSLPCAPQREGVGEALLPRQRIGYTPPMTADTQAADTGEKPDYDSPWKEALEKFFIKLLN
ncbi:hypothetical protein Thiosp_03647 [Thiorhodovibrio litoralis]|nr:hypothetical protein Thiosp_03647 [Thiorhodovibrio litoralis]